MMTMFRLRSDSNGRVRFPKSFLIANGLDGTDYTIDIYPSQGQQNAVKVTFINKEEQ